MYEFTFDVLYENYDSETIEVVLATKSKNEAMLNALQEAMIISLVPIYSITQLSCKYIGDNTLYD